MNNPKGGCIPAIRISACAQRGPNWNPSSWISRTAQKWILGKSSTGSLLRRIHLVAEMFGKPRSNRQRQRQVNGWDLSVSAQAKPIWIGNGRRALKFVLLGFRRVRSNCHSLSQTIRPFTACWSFRRPGWYEEAKL